MRVFNQRKKILAVHGLFRSAPGPVGVRWAVPMGATSSSGCSCLFNPEQNVGFFSPPCFNPQISERCSLSVLLSCCLQSRDSLFLTWLDTQ